MKELSRSQTLFLFLLPIGISLLLHLRVFELDVLGYHSWRQTQTQTTIYHFSKTEFSILYPLRFDLSSGGGVLRYEFPIYQWLIAAVNRLTSYSVLNTRVCSFLFFIFLLAGFYKLLRLFFSRKSALTGNALLCFSPLMYYYCINPLPDPLALGFAIWALYFFFRFEKKYSIWLVIGFGMALALATLVKLPYVLFAALLIPYCIRKVKERSFRQITATVVITLAALFPGAVWYLGVMASWNRNPVVAGMLKNDKDLLTLLDYFQFNVISSVPELLTNYAACILLVIGIFIFFKRRHQVQPSRIYFLTLFFAFSAYFLYEINLIGKTHDYYLMPFVPLIFVIATYGANWCYANKKSRLVFVVLCLVPLTAWLRIDTRWDVEHPGFQKDYLTEQDTLQKIIPSTALCIIDHDESGFIALYYLKRFGFSLLEGQLNNEYVTGHYYKGASFLITEAPTFDPTDFPGWNLELVFSKNIRVYKIKEL